jgi:hypothetical protein
VLPNQALEDIGPRSLLVVPCRHITQSFQRLDSLPENFDRMFSGWVWRGPGGVTHRPSAQLLVLKTSLREHVLHGTSKFVCHDGSQGSMGMEDASPVVWLAVLVCATWTEIITSLIMRSLVHFSFPKS